MLTINDLEKHLELNPSSFYPEWYVLATLEKAYVYDPEVLVLLQDEPGYEYLREE